VNLKTFPSSPSRGNTGTRPSVGLLTRAGAGVHRLHSSSRAPVYHTARFRRRKSHNSSVGFHQVWLFVTSVYAPGLNKNHRYYALSALCALFKYSEMKLNVRYSAGSLSIRYSPVEGTMMIDPETIRNLELVGNMGNRKSNHSLFGCVMP